GAGIGFVLAQELKNNPELTEVIPRREEWSAPLWIVTHVDLFRTPKVQALLAYFDEGKEHEIISELAHIKRSHGLSDIRP
ncbi:MAG: hypothetical protein AAF658_10220, partial [Myxococcota bacterium]